MLCPFLTLHYKKYMDILNRVLQRTINKMKRLEELSCKGRLRELEVVQAGEQKVPCA